MLTKIQVFLKWGTAARDLLGLRSGSFGSKYIQLFVAFFASALIHEVSAFFAYRADAGEMRFFMTQALAIFAEDTVIDTAKWIGIKGDRLGWKILGYLWVFAWFSYSLRMYVDGGVRNGLWASKDGSGSIIGKLWGSGGRI
jgi:hypothetical protein